MPGPEGGTHSCEKLLLADPRYDRFRCKPDWFKCPECGTRWVHICDESEGCFYVRSSTYVEMLRV